MIDQRVKKGEDLSYQPEFDVLENGYEYTLKVRMNQVALFGSYDHLSNEVLIDGSKVTSQDVGVYEVSFVAEFTKEDK